MNKPSNVSRRGFLRAMGVTSMGILVPSLALPEEKKLVLPEPSMNYITALASDQRWGRITMYTLHTRSPKKVISLG